MDTSHQALKDREPPGYHPERFWQINLVEPEGFSTQPQATAATQSPSALSLRFL
jgi:hypothetical protein